MTPVPGHALRFVHADGSLDRRPWAVQPGTWVAACLCGWWREAPSRREARAAFRRHKAAVRTKLEVLGR